MIKSQRQGLLRRMSSGPSLGASFWLQCKLLLQFSSTRILKPNHSVSLCFKKIDGLRYSPYIETCCDTLSSSLECRFDIYLVASVRLQCIIERMQDVLSTRSATSETSKAPAGLHVNMFRAELQSLKASLPLDIQKSCSQSLSPTVFCTPRWLIHD